MSNRQLLLRNTDVASAPLIKLAEGKAKIGRDPTCEIVVADPSVSRFHAELTIRETSISVRDLGSRNGTYVDTERVDEAPLVVGQNLSLGAVRFAVETFIPNSGGDVAVETESLDDGTDESRLSAAERRVFDLMLPGLAEKKIAGRLGISRHTVHTHIRRIYEIFGVRSRAELSALFIKQRNGSIANHGESTLPGVNADVVTRLEES
jgi:pSer/pThr/pTyr-binding forkhead associated (FHA) protein